MDNSNSNSKNDGASVVQGTVETFAGRIRRRMEESERLADQSVRDAEARTSSMLHALTAIRKALQETSKISLGQRYAFELAVSDFEGWPRMDLRLMDRQAGAESKLDLVVTAHDRRQAGLVQIATGNGELLSRLHLGIAGEFEKLPVQLKSAIRKYLDKVGQYILTPEEKRPAPINEHPLEETPALRAIANEDLFADENHGDDKLVQSVDVQPLDPL